MAGKKILYQDDARRALIKGMNIMVEAVSVTLGTIGSVGFWGVIVTLPAVQAEFDVARGEASIPYTLTMIGFAVTYTVFLPHIINQKANTVEPHTITAFCLFALANT